MKSQYKNEKKYSSRKSKTLPGIHEIFLKSKNSNVALNAICSIFSYCWESLSVTYHGYTEGLVANLLKVRVNNVPEVIEDSKLLLSEFSWYIGISDAQDMPKATRKLRQLADKISDTILSKNINSTVIKNSLLVEGLRIWELVGLDQVGDRYLIQRSNFDFTSKFKKLGNDMIQVSGNSNNLEKKIRNLVRSIVYCGWALSHREFGNPLAIAI
ncbi:hypothetical protein AB3N59_19785 [Leptospira sp. WS92.C1]